MSTLQVDALGVALMVVVALVARAIGVPVWPCVAAVVAAAAFLVWDVRRSRSSDDD